MVENISNYNLMMQAVGFNPAEVAEARERAGVSSKFDDKLLKRRAALIDQYNAAWQEKDRQGVQEVLADIKKFNRKNPRKGLIITPDTLMKSLIGRRTRQLQSVDGLYLPYGIRSRVEELAGN